MAYQKLQPTQALNVILSDTINPINPSRPANVDGTTVAPNTTNRLTYLDVASVLTTGTIDGGPTAIKLIDSTADFEAAPAVEEGDTVLNTTDATYAIVVSVDSPTELTISADIMTTLDDEYTIYTGQGFRDKVSVGDLVLNEDLNTLTAVTGVHQTQLQFGSDAFPTAPDNFKAYGSPAQMNSETEAFVVYVGGGDANEDIKVTTAAGNDIVFGNFPLGGFLPVQCLRVWSTGTASTNIVALW